MPPEKSKKDYNERLQKRVLKAIDLVGDKNYFNRDGLEDSIQKLRQIMERLGLESEFEYNGDGISRSDHSSAASTASDRSEINDVAMELNPHNETLDQASNCKDSSMEIEHSANNVILTDMNTNVNSDNIEIDSIGETINSVIANNCNEIDMSKGEEPGCNADANIMNIDPPDSNLISPENDGYQTQGRKRGRVPSNESIPSKKLTRSNSLPLQNKFNALANLPDTGNNQDPTNATSQTKIPKIPPVTLRKPVNYRDLLKQINEKEGIKCNAKEAGEFIKLFCEPPEI
ncbi:hypothetical protein AVEN_228698-1 [Araneus ventricosus]|uniref:Uncharacterized protein n=1 Tax=Araneus ventricosus TaxID=182803 RepID=A0A4Y2LQT5_ARAVE|nr:hypothetical protein AVEN_228698-1 [Araneus ventricosus]